MNLNLSFGGKKFKILAGKCRKKAEVDKQLAGSNITREEAIRSRDTMERKLEEMLADITTTKSGTVALEEVLVFHEFSWQQCCGIGTGTAIVGTATFCLSGAGFNIKWNTKVKKNQK